MNCYLKLKKFLKVILFRNPIKYAKWLGVSIGEDSLIINHPNWGTEPYLICIGKHTEISFDVTFLTHDGGTWIFREDSRYKDKNIMKFGKISIGNNYFIGCKSIIMPGVTIGDNCIIAAGSIVTKSIQDGQVWGGVPAKFISTSEDYIKKCEKNNKDYNMENFNKDKKRELVRIFK